MGTRVDIWMKCGNSRIEELDHSYMKQHGMDGADHYTRFHSRTSISA
jgi:hypothetical protein